MTRLLTAVLIGTLLTVGACGLSSTDCGPFPNKFKTTGFTTSIHQVEFPDSLGPRPQLSPIMGDTLGTGPLAIQMQPDIETYYAHRFEESPLQVLPSAYACSPALPSSDEVIEDIRIYGDTNFGDDHLAGDDLSALFDIVVYRKSRANDGYHGYRRFDLNTFLARDPTAAYTLFLVLEESPSTTTEVTFTVEYEQNGRGLSSYSFRTEPVVLLAE